MGIIDDIANLIQANTTFEEWSQVRIDALRASVRTAKILSPGVQPAIMALLRTQLIGEGGHARDALAERLFDHYFFGLGATYTLSDVEMRQMAVQSSPPLTLAQYGYFASGTRSEWTEDFARARGARGDPATIEHSGELTWVHGNGAIARFRIIFDGWIDPGRERSNPWKGTIRFSDRFDFNPNWNWNMSSEHQRSLHGERRTRIGYILEAGMDFDIDSATLVGFQAERAPVLTLRRWPLSDTDLRPGGVLYRRPRVLPPRP